MHNLSPDELKRYIPNTSTSPEDIVMPGQSTGESTWSKGEGDTSDLKTENIEEALFKDELKNVLLKQSDEIKIPSYLLDLSKVELATAALLAIKGLLPGGNTHVYIKEVTGEVILVGSGDDYVLYTVLEEVLKSMFGPQCKIYKNNGDGFRPIGKMDVSSVRLNL